MKILSAVLFIIFSSVEITGSLFTPGSLSTAAIVDVSELNSGSREVRELLLAPSFVPEEEIYTHIAGGYFSFFDSKTGRIRKSSMIGLPPLKRENLDSTVKASGSLKIVLSNLEYESRFVYLLKGELILSKGSKDAEIFNLKKLDYVQIPGSDIPAYRLSAVNPENNRKASLIATAHGTDVPKLIGSLYIEDNNDLESFDIRIYGRNTNEAESHLCKKMEFVSDFTCDPVRDRVPISGSDESNFESLSLSFGDGATDFEKEIAERAFALALSRYKEMGFEFPELELPEVYFDTPANWEEKVLENTIALYNTVEQYVLMMPFDSTIFQEQAILGTKGDEDIFFSILFHEFCHHLNHQVNPLIAPHHDEFVACALQLSTLPERLRNQVVDDFGGTVFRNRDDITLLAYISTPKQFQVASYLFANNHEAQVKLIILNSHHMIRDPFLVKRT
ncbi:MAG: hypothetical protein KAU17_08645 [Spirochaetales bacterium]|nr:hypothetical protein [Spirochaetales bacterium]